MAKMIGLARLGRDAELRYSPSGDAVCNLSLAFTYGQKQQDGNRPTQWVDASLWGKRAEQLVQYLTKGSVHCFTLSDVHLETYTGKNGDGVKLVARVDDVELGPRAGGDAGQAQQPASRPAAQPQPQQSRPAPRQEQFDDTDIPF